MATLSPPPTGTNSSANPAPSPNPGRPADPAPGNPNSAITGVTGIHIIGPDEANHLAQAFKTLADPTRIRLLSTLAAQPDGAACVCELTGPIGLTQPTVSHHLKRLVAAGLASRQQRGKWAHYAIVPEALERLAATLTPGQGFV
ncbi:MAG: metalloregulator ArsR/SmtB family transcription factor [Bifidobacteriaceae bacterium]|nr:metalloregulator ArsR/SmtB family transcription factor [Bifidobacteriaceae bacterium]